MASINQTLKQVLNLKHMDNPNLLQSLASGAEPTHLECILHVCSTIYMILPHVCEVVCN